MNITLKSVARKLTYVFVALVIFIAILVTVVRLMTPVIDKHRADFEKWASDLLEIPVTIDKVNVSWYGYQPEISLNQVTLLSKDTNEPELQIQKIRIFFSIPKSIWNWKPIPSGILVSGADINIRQSASGEFTIQGFPSFGGFEQQPYKREAKFYDILSWLSDQPRLILRDIDIRYSGFAGQKRFVSLYHLNFINSDTEHSISGDAILHQDIPTELNVAVRWHGPSKVDLAQIKAKIYVYVSGLALSQWMKGYTWNNWQINNGVGSSKIWATWDHGKFKKIQGTFQIFGLDLFSTLNKTTHKVNRISGNLGWKRDGIGQVFAGDDILIDLPERLWPATSFYVLLVPDDKGNLSPKAVDLGFIDLADLQKLFFASSPVLPDDIKQTLLKLKLQGSLQNAAVIFNGPWNDWHHVSLNANVSQIGFSPVKQLPGMRNLSGLLKWNGVQGELVLNSKLTEFRYDSIFTQPIKIEELSGNVIVHQDQNDAWIMNIPSVRLLNRDLAANVKGLLTIPKTGSPISNLTANFTMQKASHITHYLPTRIFEKDTLEWLQKAFLDGEVESGTAQLRGELVDFPFDKNNGTFVVSGKIKNVDLHYALDWPDLNRASGVLTFAGRKMDVAIDSAQINNMPITKIKANIPYLGDAQPQVLYIQSEEFPVEFAQGLAFIHASPLEKTIGKIFSDISVDGSINLKLGLTIPLKTPDAVKVQGQIGLKGNAMKLVPWKLELDQLNGMLYFTEDSTDAQNIQGKLFNQPLQLNLVTLQKTKNKKVMRATIASKLNMNDLEAWLKVPLTKVVSGETDVQGELNFALNEPMEVHLKSNLVGVAINLPEKQYAKKAQESRQFITDIFAQEKAPLKVKLAYGDLLRAALILDYQNDKFNIAAADLRIGKGEPVWPKSSGLYISGDFDTLDWDKIKSYVNQSGGANANITNLPLREVNIYAKTLNIVGQNFNQAQIKVIPGKEKWTIDLTSSEAIGKIKFPVNMTRSSHIDAQFQRLSLRPVKTISTMPLIDVKSLPSITFDASNVSYNSIPFGRVTFQTTPALDGLDIKSLRIYSSRLDLQANGEWGQVGNNYETHLQGTAASGNVSNFLNSLGLDVHNFETGRGALNFNLGWNDAPYSPAMAKMRGRTSFKLGKGRIVEVSQASGAKMDIGRMLSLFSLQSIPRRLSLDFSDVFHKGYSFDSIKGDVKFETGDAYTSNMKIEGPIARVDIYGRIGLARKDYDLTLSITPYAASGLPVAAVLIGGVTGPVGLAAVAVGGFLGNQISKASSYYYSVTGAWDNPTWTSISVPPRRG